MKAILELENSLHLLTFKLKGINLTIQVPDCITSLKIREFDSDGYMEFDTNVGIESMDLLYDIDGLLTDKQMKLMKDYLNGDREIEVRCLQ